MKKKAESSDIGLDEYIVERQWQILIHRLYELNNLLSMTSGLYKKINQVITFVKATYKKYVENNNRLKQLSPHVKGEPIVTSTLKELLSLKVNN